jgi:hypothetical protein
MAVEKGRLPRFDRLEFFFWPEGLALASDVLHLGHVLGFGSKLFCVRIWVCSLALPCRRAALRAPKRAVGFGADSRFDSRLRFRSFYPFDEFGEVYLVKHPSLCLRRVQKKTKECAAGDDYGLER